MNTLSHLTAISTPYAQNSAPEGANSNVVERFKAFSHEQIMADLDPRRTELVNVVVNLSNDFNKASVIRAHNAHNGRMVVVAGRRKYNRIGTVGTHNYTHVVHVADPLEAVKALIEDGYTVCAVDNVPDFNPQPIGQVKLPSKTAFVYGEEGLGLERSLVEACNGPVVYLPQHGSVRSINVAQMAAVAMFAYDLQHPRDELF